MAYRIHRVVRPDAVVILSSGVLDADHAAKLQELLATERSDRVVLDLNDVTRVDRAAVRYLARLQAAGMAIVNCPDYVRSWIAGESGDDPELSQ